MTLKALAAYGKGFQLKVLGSLLTDKKFLLNVRDVLREEYFDADTHKWIVNEIISYFDKYHNTITMDVLKVELQKIDNEVLQVAVKEDLRHSYEASQDDLEYVQEEFTSFCKNQEMKQAILASAELLKQSDFDGIRNMIELAMKAGMDKNIGHEYNEDIEARYREDYRPVIPTPWPILNDAIQGGFGPGDLAIIFGSPGGGKCVDYNTAVNIEYPEYGIECINSNKQPFTLWFTPWEEFFIEDHHFYGWQIAQKLELKK